MRFRWDTSDEWAVDRTIIAKLSHNIDLCDLIKKSDQKKTWSFFLKFCWTMNPLWSLPLILFGNVSAVVFTPLSWIFPHEIVQKRIDLTGSAFDFLTLLDFIWKWIRCCLYAFILELSSCNRAKMDWSNRFYLGFYLFKKWINVMSSVIVFT